MRADRDAKLFSNISANTAQFELDGGLYEVMITATWGGGNSVLVRYSQTEATVLATHTALTADGRTTVNLPKGKYRLNVTTATALYASIIRIPGD